MTVPVNTNISGTWLSAVRRRLNNNLHNIPHLAGHKFHISSFFTARAPLRPATVSSSRFMCY